MWTISVTKSTSWSSPGSKWRVIVRSKEKYLQMSNNLVFSDRELLSWDGEGSRGQLCRVAKIPGCLKIFPKTVKTKHVTQEWGCGRDWVPGWGGDIQEGGGLLYALPGPASFAHHAVTQTGSFLSLSNHIPPESKTPLASSAFIPYKACEKVPLKEEI